MVLKDPSDSRLPPAQHVQTPLPLAETDLDTEWSKKVKQPGHEKAEFSLPQ